MSLFNARPKHQKRSLFTGRYTSDRVSGRPARYYRSSVARLSLTCSNCGEPFAAKRRTARFCSERCKKAYQRARQRANSILELDPKATTYFEGVEKSIPDAAKLVKHISWEYGSDAGRLALKAVAHVVTFAKQQVEATRQKTTTKRRGFWSRLRGGK